MRELHGYHGEHRRHAHDAAAATDTSGKQKLDDVFSDEGLVTVPLYATANLLLSFRPRDKHWWEYLDQIWDAAVAAVRTPLSVFPALMLRAREPSERPSA